LYETPVTSNKFGMRRVNSLQLKKPLKTGRKYIKEGLKLVNKDTAKN
jgi:hypothetical protein